MMRRVVCRCCGEEYETTATSSMSGFGRCDYCRAYCSAKAGTYEHH